MAGKIDLKYWFTISVLLIIILNTIIALTSNNRHIEIKVIYGNGEPASDLEIILSKPTKLFKCGMSPASYNILSKALTDEHGIADFNVTGSIDKICIFVKYGDNYIDLDKTDPYSRGYLLDLSESNGTYIISLDIYPPAISMYNLSIIIQKLESGFKFQDFRFWLIVVDNEPNELDVTAKMFIGNRTFSLAIAGKDLLDVNSVNVSFGQLLPMLYGFIEEELQYNRTPYILLTIKDNEGFTLLKRINITWQNIRYMEINRTIIEENLSNIINTLTFRPNNTETTSGIMFSPTNITEGANIVEENKALLGSSYNVFIPLIGIATIILEYWRRRSTR